MAISEEGDRPMWFLVILLTQLLLVANVLSDESEQDSVRWAVSEFSPCSAECGGGSQERTVQCVRSQRSDDVTKEVEVEDHLCTLPIPDEERPCNTHMCTGYWARGEWSECSETCGTGTQTREVTCESSVWQQTRVQIAPAHCPGNKPESSRQCHVTDCVDYSQLPSIVSENYTLIQLHKAKKIKVNIGGQVNLFPGQTVIVRCPVRKYDKHLVYWSRGYKLVKFMGRVRFTSKGLHIDEANPSEDAGVYTCFAGDLSATVTVGFIDEDDPMTKVYKRWIKKSKEEYKINNAKHSNNGRDSSNNVLPPSTSLEADEQRQQRDQSQNSSNVLMYVVQDWTPCNATCQSVGYQERNVTCSHVAPKFVKIVANSECQKAGLKNPDVSRECKTTEASCAVWRTGPWSQCRPSCGQVGYKSRILSCVWQSSGEPAGPRCDQASQPEAIKPCKTRPCPSECTDLSKYCSLTKMLKLCRYHHFKAQCCQTCKAHPTAPVYNFSPVIA